MESTLSTSHNTVLLRPRRKSRRRSGSADLQSVTCHNHNNISINDTPPRQISPIPARCLIESFYTLGSSPNLLSTPTPQSLRLAPRTDFSSCQSVVLDRQRMHYRNLGNSGLKVSRLGLAPGLSTYPLRNNSSSTANNLNSSSSPNVNGSAGSLNVDDSAEQIFNLAYEAGINYFDTYDVGQLGRTEILLGKIIKKKKWRRSSYAVAVRVHRSGVAETERGLSRKHIVESVQGSLERLGLQYVDIVFAHGRDASTSIEEIVRAFSWIVEKGWAFYWGTCQWTQAQIMEAYTVARLFHLIPPLVDQSEYNFFKRQPVELAVPELLCTIGCGSVTWAALANGLLSNDALDSIGSFNDYYQANAEALAAQQQQQLPSTGNETKGFYYTTGRPLSLIEFPPSLPFDREGVSDLTIYRQKVKYLRPIAEQIGCSLPQLAIAWCLRTDFVQSCLISPASVEQLREQLMALSVIDRLTPEILAVIERVLSNQPRLASVASTIGNLPPSSVKALERQRMSIPNATKASKEAAQLNRRRSVASGHRKSVSSSPRLSISHTGGYGRDSVDYSSYDRRPSHI